MKRVLFAATSLLFALATCAPPPTELPTAGPPQGFDQSDFALIDEHALQTPATAERSIAELSAYLVGPANDDFESARAIFRWITHNIAYDVQAYGTRDYGDQRANAVLVRRTGVCSGYANLFNALAKAAGMKVAVVGGWAKGYGYAPDGP